MRTDVRQARKPLLLTKHGMTVLALMLAALTLLSLIATAEGSSGDLDAIDNGPTIGAANAGYQVGVVVVASKFFVNFRPAPSFVDTFGAANVDRPFDPEMRLFRDIPPLFQRLPTVGAVNA